MKIEMKPRILLWLVLVLPVAGCGNQSAPTEPPPVQNDQLQPWLEPDLDHKLGPWRQDAELADLRVAPQLKLTWPQRSLTMIQAAGTPGIDPARWLVVDAMDNRTILYLKRGEGRFSEVRIAPDRQTTVRIILPPDTESARGMAQILVTDTTGLHRYRPRELPPQLQEQLQSYCEPFAAWSGSTTTPPGLTGETVRGTVVEFVDRFCTYALSLWPHAVFLGDEDIWRSIVICRAICAWVEWGGC